MRAENYLLLILILLSLGGCQMQPINGTVPLFEEGKLPATEEPCAILRPTRTALEIGDHKSKSEILASIANNSRVPINTIRSGRRFGYVHSDENSDQYFWARNTQEYILYTKADVITFVAEFGLEDKYNLQDVLECYGTPTHYSAWFDFYLSYPYKWTVIFLFYPEQGVILQIAEPSYRLEKQDPDNLQEFSVDHIIWTDASTLDGVIDAYSQLSGVDESSESPTERWLLERAIPWTESIKELIYLDGEYRQ